MRWISVLLVALLTIGSCAHHKKKDNTLLLLLLLIGGRGQAANPQDVPQNPPAPVVACPANDQFGKADILTGGNNTLLINAKPWTYNQLAAFLVGWDFSGAQQFHLTLGNKTPGRKYFLTAYGVYDKSTGHECDVYFQRWGNSLLPVENFDFTTTGTLSVDGIDNSLPNPAGGFFSFSRTYVQLIVFDANGKDVTDTDTATVSLDAF